MRASAIGATVSCCRAGMSEPCEDLPAKRDVIHGGAATTFKMPIRRGAASPFRRMANDVALNHIYDIFGNIGGMVRNPLQLAGDHKEG